MPRSQSAIEPLFLTVDKPAGLSSHDVVAILRAVTGIKKIGHTGTLDPFATGVLPLAIGTATRLIQFLPEREKTYIAHLQLGQATNTGDCEGTVTEAADCPPLDLAQVEQVFQSFLGRQKQVPPLFSALKVNGRRAYEYARAGESLELDAREIHIYDLKCLELTAQTIVFEARVSKGTYIRTLGEDIAKKLGTLGHLTALRRTQSGPFTLAQALSFEQLCHFVSPESMWQQAFQAPREARPPRQERSLVRKALSPYWLRPQGVFADYPQFELSEYAAKLAYNGNIPIELPELNSEYLILTHESRLVAICSRDLKNKGAAWRMGRVISSAAVSIQSVQ